MTAAVTLPDGIPTAMTSRHLSETVEHYTPPEIIESARVAMGGIDLDPATTIEANKIVKAARYFTRVENGYHQEWRGRIFLNPPGGLSDDLEQVVKPNCRVTGSCGLPGGTKKNPGHRHSGVQSNQKKWWFKAAREWWQQRASSVVFVMFSVELLQTTQVDTPMFRTDCADDGILLPIPLEYTICFPRKRLAYHKADGSVGKSPPHSSGIVLLSSEKETIWRFYKEFEQYGHVNLGRTARIHIS